MKNDEFLEILFHKILLGSTLRKIHHSSFFILHSSVFIPHSSFLVPHSSFLILHSSFFIPHSFFIFFHFLFFIFHSSLFILYSLVSILHCSFFVSQKPKLYETQLQLQLCLQTRASGIMCCQDNMCHRACFHYLKTAPNRTL